MALQLQEAWYVVCSLCGYRTSGIGTTPEWVRRGGCPECLDDERIAEAKSVARIASLSLAGVFRPRD